MASDGEIRWYSPDPRGILPLERGAHSATAGAGRAPGHGFGSQIDTAFGDVIRACAEDDRDPEDPEPGSTSEIIESYIALHELGLAHSVEAWHGDRLVGGLYGVALRGTFFGESMFHRETDASKVALVALVERLRARGYRLLDTQWVTPHLEQFGAIEIPRDDYLKLLEESLRLDCTFV